MATVPTTLEELVKIVGKLTYTEAPNVGRVVIELAQKHKHQGKLYNVRIDVRVPGKELVATHKLNQEILGLLNNPARTKLMVAAGKARMGAPGASDAIAKVLIARLQGQILQ